MNAQGVLEGWERQEERPSYRPPRMAEVRALPLNGLTAAGSFSGCGGSSLGLRMAGFRTRYAIEFVDAAAETYEANFPETYVDRRDVREISADEVLDKLALAPGELDLWEGSPPCASFSAAGLREKAWQMVKSYSDTRQRTDDLFFEWTRILAGLMPRAFIAENVPGLIAGAAVEEYAYRITAELSRLGYRVNAKILTAAAYGVPQLRNRLIFLGLRRDVSPEPPRFPPPQPFSPYTLREALAVAAPSSAEDLEGSSMEGYAVGRTWKVWQEYRAAGREPHFPSMPCERCGEPLEAHTVLARLGDDSITKAECADGERAVILKDYYSLVVPRLDEPCPTITATGSQQGAGSVTHPTECRKLTPNEMKAVSGFPPDFILTGSRQQRAERIGRAVPPPMYRACGLALAEQLR